MSLCSSFSSLSLSHSTHWSVHHSLILQSTDQLDSLQVEHFQQGETNRASAWDKFLIWSHTGLPGLLLPLKQLVNYFPCNTFDFFEILFFALLFLLDWVLPVTNGLVWKEPECQYTWPRLVDPWCLTCASICCTGSLQMLGNGNFLDRTFNHAFASPPCHKRSFSLPAIYLPTYPFRLWITKITVTMILCWDVYQDMSLLSSVLQCWMWDLHVL